MEIKLEAVLENLERVNDAIEQVLVPAECPMKVLIQVKIAVEEMFVNVCHYAYEDEIGMITVAADIVDIADKETGKLKKGVKVVLTDQGIPYDPLAKEDPDVTLSLEERPIGGLGIYMVKKSMDEVFYQYENNSNIFTMIKAFR
ncbi:MAG: ATP-binding protein [Lachnospiraceae bacterium]|nr:ATP-binding protein [Lachnospiraceae bacterium]